MISIKTFANCAESYESKVEEYWSDDETEPASGNHPVLPDTRGCCGRQENSSRVLRITQPGKYLQCRYVKHNAAVAKHRPIYQIYDTEHDQEQEDSGTRQEAGGEYQQLEGHHTQSVSEQPKQKSCSVTLDSSCLPHTKSSSVGTEKHPQVTVYQQARLSSNMRNLASVTTNDQRCRNLTVSTHTFDSRAADHLAGSTTSYFPQMKVGQNPKQNFSSTMGTISRNGSNCRCSCHKQPIEEFRRCHEDGSSTTEMKQRPVSSTAGLEKISRDFGSAARERKTGDERDASRCSVQFDRSTDSDEDENRDVQLLTTAIANRLSLDFFL